MHWQAVTNTATVSSHGPDGIANTADDLVKAQPPHKVLVEVGNSRKQHFVGSSIATHNAMQPTPKQHRPTAGFTLIEIMVVVAILGLLATLVVINIGPAMDDARDQRIQTDLTTIADATKLYHLQKGVLPSMEALMTPDEQDRTYINDPSLDPWKAPYHILPGDSKRTFFVVCAGKDKTLDTEDDVSKKARL